LIGKTAEEGHVERYADAFFEFLQPVGENGSPFGGIVAARSVGLVVFVLRFVVVETNSFSENAAAASQLGA